MDAIKTMIDILPKSQEVSEMALAQAVGKAIHDQNALGNLACKRMAFIALSPTDEGRWRALILGHAEPEVIANVQDFIQRGAAENK